MQPSENQPPLSPSNSSSNPPLNTNSSLFKTLYTSSIANPSSSSAEKKKRNSLQLQHSHTIQVQQRYTVPHPADWCMGDSRLNPQQNGIPLKTTSPIVKVQNQNIGEGSSSSRRVGCRSSSLQLLQLAAGEFFPVLVDVSHSPVAVSVVVHLPLQSETTAKVFPDVETYWEQRQGSAARERGVRVLTETGTESLAGWGLYK